MQSNLLSHDFAVQSEKRDALHVAIIMDGNGRWAARRAVERAPEVGIGRLTLYAFSSDNWRRPSAEVRSIFWLLRAFLRLERERLRQAGVRLEAIGRRDRIPKLLLREIDQAECVTAAGRRLHLQVAIDYSSRDAIARAAHGVCTALAAERPCSAEALGRVLAETLTAGSGEVDLLIRTGGEKRLSDFLLWECAYAELWFSDRMWPDFDASDLDAALLEFSGRERRFGGVPEVAACAETASIGGGR